MLIPVARCSCSVKLKLLTMAESRINSNGKENGIIKLLLSGYVVIFICQIVILWMVTKLCACWSECTRENIK